MKLIKTKHYLLLIDEEAEIRDRDYFIRDNPPLDFKPKRFIEKRGVLNPSSKCNRIKAYYPIKEAKELKGLPLLPNPFDDKTYWIATVIFKDGTKLKSEKFYKYDSGIKSWSSNFSYLMEDKIECINYDKYTENHPEQFSLGDVKKAFNAGYDLNTWEQLGIPNEERDYLNEYEYIQSLSTQRLPKEFIPDYQYRPSTGETTYIQDGWEYNQDGINERKLKTITNSEGKQELVGEYKY